MVPGMKDILVALDASSKTPLTTPVQANPGKEPPAPVDLVEINDPHETFQLPRSTSNMESRHSLHTSAGLSEVGLTGLETNAVAALGFGTDALTSPRSGAKRTKLDAQTGASTEPMKTGAWSHEEHERYCAALKQYRHGSWKLIASCVGTRTDRQVMSHAQSIREKNKRYERWQQRSQVAELQPTAQHEQPLGTGQDSTARGGWSFEEPLIAPRQSDRASGTNRVYTQEHSGDEALSHQSLFFEFPFQHEN